MGQTDADYYAARALEARRLSLTADDVRAGCAHALMADRYEALAAECRAQRKTLGIAVG
jgi:hypothetical protein